MRIVLAGAGHWHVPLVLAGLEEAGHGLAGVWDEDAARAAELARRLGCRAFTSLGQMLDEVRPHLAFALGRHCMMPSIARELIARRVPFSLEKPGGLDAAAVKAVAGEARAAGVMASVPFVNRHAPWLRRLEGLIAAGTLGPVLQASFTDIAGPPARYRAARCAWMLDPAQAGGGALVNLGIHFLDLARRLAGGEPAVAGAVLSRATFREAVEDHALLTLHDGAGFSAHIEVGYGFPDPAGRHQAVRMAGPGWHLSVGEGSWRLATSAGVREEVDQLDAAPLMRSHVHATIAAVRGEGCPTASLEDLAAAMRLAGAAYDLAAGIP